MVNRFVLNGISYHGAGAIKEIPGIIKSKGFKKAFVASDPDLVKFGVTAKVTDLLDQEGLAYEIYSDIKPNPTIENVKSGVAAYKASGADYMITIGGGSSMDTGKAIGIIINNPEFADVRSFSGGRCSHEEQNRIYHRCSDHSRHSCRGNHQLRHHRCGEKEKICLC